MKYFVCLLLAAASVQARENAYDVVGKVLQPLAQMLAADSKSPNRAVTMALRLEQSKGLPAEVAGARVNFALEMPDRLRLSGPFGGQQITICRVGQSLWASPGSRLQALLDDPAFAKRLPPPNKKFKLAPFSLPIPEKQLAFLPVLFQTRDAGDEAVDGVECQVLDVQVMPELMKSVDAKGWSARAWVAADDRLTRLKVNGPGGSATLRFDELKYQRALPPETWKPTVEESADVMELSPKLYDQIVRAFFTQQ